MKQKKVTFSVYMPQKYADKIILQSVKENLSLSEVIVEAVKYYYETMNV